MGEIEQTLGVTESKAGIKWCINCVGFHPSDEPALEDFWKRLTNPQKAVFQKHVQTQAVVNDYRNKSCMMCGRTYDKDGKCDETWKLTAERVKEELTHAGLFGVDDKKIEMIVAQCRKSFMTLLKYRFSIPKEKWPYMTFSGCLAYIITVAQETKREKNGVPEFNGPVKL